MDGILRFQDCCASLNSPEADGLLKKDQGLALNEGLSEM